jgi:formylglycine-generating enzyme required for sulfatase activity
MARVGWLAVVLASACGGASISERGGVAAVGSDGPRSDRAPPPAAAGRARVAAGEVTLGAGDATLEAEVRLCTGAGVDPGACRARLQHEQPARRVALPAFLIDVHEVTNSAYAACVARGACPQIDFAACETLGIEGLPERGVPEGHALRAADHPVVCATQAQAEAYCRFAGGHLPSEAEWERAAEGDDERLFPWGNAWSPTALNWGEGEAYGSVDGHVFTAPVGSYPAGKSPFGALDMAGNAWEWTAGRYNGSDKAVTRGGGYVATPMAFTTNHRAPQRVGRVAVNIGFRCAAEAR